MRIVITYLIYYLIRCPEHLTLIRQEFSSIDVRDYKSLQYLEHLNACIYETLRLFPAVPSGGPRLPPNEGITVNGHFIPKGTTLVTPQYSPHRGQSSTRNKVIAQVINMDVDERYFVKPEEWIPERFTTKPELVLDKSAFAPWAIGKSSHSFRG